MDGTRDAIYFHHGIPLQVSLCHTVLQVLAVAQAATFRPLRKVCSHHQCALWTSTFVCGARAVLLYKENCQFVARPGAFVVAHGHTSHFFSFLRCSEHSPLLNPMQNANLCRVLRIGGADTCTGSCPCHVVFLTCLFLLCLVFYLRMQMDFWFLHDFGTDTELEHL